MKETRFVAIDREEGDGNGCETLDEAKAWAESRLEQYRDAAADEGWPEDLEILVAEVVARAEAFNVQQRPATEEEEEEEEWDSHFDTTCEYRIAPTETRLDAALALLAEYERWEADMIEDDTAWAGDDGFPALTLPLYDRLIALQEKRNALLHPKG